MALKKPSDFFGNNKKTPLDEVKEEYIAASPEKIEQVSEAFDIFKDNLNHIKSLSDFTNTFDSFKENLEKVETVSEEIFVIKEDLKELIKKEDLDSAMMAQLLFVQESISKIESKISSINGETVDKIKEDFSNLSNSVESFIDIDVPKYKKLVSESEVRVDDRFVKFKEEIKENFDSIKSDTSKEVASALETVGSLNENIISDIKSDFTKTTKDVKSTVSDLVEKELPKYKKFFAETELRTEEKIKTSIDSYQETIENLNATVKEFTENEIPKYNNLLIENKIKSEKEVKELEEQVLSKVNILTEKIESISEGIYEKTEEKIGELQSVIEEYKGEINSISKTYDNLYKDFRKREISENEKLEHYSSEIERYHKRFDFLEEAVTEDLREIQGNLVTSNENYHASLKTEVRKFRDKISDQMKGLEVDLVVNEKHVNKQNETIENIREEIKDVFDKLQLDELEKKNKELVDKINLIEEKITDFNEKKLLKEDNPTLPGDPSTNNSGDPLTPLNQKFATLDDLQNHYRTFINRIQQQIATIGGGGAGFIKDLDDVTFDQTTGQGQLLIYNGAKWVGIASTAVGGGAASELAENATGTNLTLSGDLNVSGDIVYDEATARNWNVSGIATATKVHVGVDTGFYNEDLVVNGDARVTGILTIGTGSITLDPNERKITGIDEIIIGTATTVRIHQDTSGEVVFSDREGKQASVGIGTTVSINTTGIVTAATLKATTAFYPPIYTTTQRDAGSFNEGAIIFNTTSKKMEFYDGTNWQSLPGMTLGLTVALDG